MISNIDKNPWSIQSIFDLRYFVCPSCSYKDHSKQQFVNHALKSHPSESKNGLLRVSDQSLNDIDFSWSVMKNILSGETDIFHNEDFAKDNNEEEFKEEKIDVDSVNQQTVTIVPSIGSNLDILSNSLTNKEESKVPDKNELFSVVSFPQSFVMLPDLKVHHCSHCEKYFCTLSAFQKHVNETHTCSTVKISIVKAKKEDEEISIKNDDESDYELPENDIFNDDSENDEEFDLIVNLRNMAM